MSNIIDVDNIISDSDQSDDDQSDVVVLAEAVIDPMEPNTASLERKFKRKIESGPSEVVIPTKSKKQSSVFKMFGGKNQKKRKDKSGDDNMMSEHAIKDQYITHNFGRRQSKVTSDSDHSPSMVHFQNLTPDPDLAGIWKLFMYVCSSSRV